MEAFVGTWQLVSTERFDEYMEAIGVSSRMRNYGCNMKTALIFSQDGDNIVIKIKMYEATNRSFTVSFKLGEEFEESTLDFRVCKSVIYLEEDKLVHLQKWDGKEATITSQIQDGNLISTSVFGDVSCVHVHEKI